MADINKFSSLRDALYSLFGADMKYSEPVSGGDINESYRLTLENGENVFMKMNLGASESFFKAEADGLRAIADTGAISVPSVICYGMDNGRAFLLLELIESGRKKRDFWELFGRALAMMHFADTSLYVSGGKYGFISDNYIGRSVQKNNPHSDWISFFRDCRLLPQFRMAEKYFDRSERASIIKFLDKLDTLLIEPDRPSLLHGDLWSGNFMTDRDGNAVLIDPAVYVGSAEVDIAMTQLFGGFDSHFYGAYMEAVPMQPGYSDRRDIYNLYHLLNHLNMFGASYFSSVKRIIERYA